MSYLMILFRCVLAMQSPYNKVAHIFLFELKHNLSTPSNSKDVEVGLESMLDKLIDHSSYLHFLLIWKSIVWWK